MSLIHVRFQNVKLRLSSLPAPRGSTSYDLVISSAPQAPTLVIPQLTSVKTSINNGLDVIDVTTWAGNAKDANYVAGQLQLLHDNIQEARQSLKGYSDVQLPWWEHPVDENVCSDLIYILIFHEEHANPSLRSLTLNFLQTSPSTSASSMPLYFSRSVPSRP